MSVHHSGSRTLGLQLPPALQLHILSLLPPNDRALSGRLVAPDAAAALVGPDHCTAFLSFPLPPHAVPWAVEAGQQHVRQLPFRHRLQLLCTAAASGSEVNLEVALALLQPSVLPDVLHRNVWRSPAYPNPGVAAVAAGHPQLLGRLFRHCPALLADLRAVLRAAAKHCDLAGLQAAWEALGCDNSGPSSLIDQEFLDRVAASPVDAVAKVEWVLAQGRGSCSLQMSTAAAAACSGDLGRLQWLRGRGCPMDLSTLESALQHADLAVAQWLVDDAGCELPAAAGQRGWWETLLVAAAMSPDGMPKLQWLRERGAPPLGGDSDLIQCMLCSAADAGRVEAVRHLLLFVPLDDNQQLDVDPELMYCAVASGSIPTVEHLLQIGLTATYEAYEVAADAVADKDHLAGGNDVAMIRWLVQVAGVSAVGFNLPEVLRKWPKETPSHSRGLLEAVQLLVGEAGCRGWDTRMALITAARQGELALVQYLLQQRPEYRPGWDLLVAAAEGGCEALLEWLVEQHPGCLEASGSGVSPYASAAARGDLGTLTALRRLGVPWGERGVVVWAVRNGCSGRALRWLVEQGAPVGGMEDLKSEAYFAMRCGSLLAEDVAWVRSLCAAQ